MGPVDNSSDYICDEMIIQMYIILEAQNVYLPRSIKSFLLVIYIFKTVFIEVDVRFARSFFQSL